MVAQLRIYRIRDGLMDEWLQLFFGELLDCHALVDIPVTAAWRNPSDPAEFVWVREFEAVDTVEEQERAFFSTPRRKKLGDVRGTFVESLEVRVLEPYDCARKDQP